MFKTNSTKPPMDAEDEAEQEEEEEENEREVRDDDDDDAAERDLNVANYALSELLDALGLSGKPSRFETNQAVDQLVRQHSATDPELAHFFSEAGAAVLASTGRWSSKDAGNVAVNRIINVDSYYRESLLDPPDHYTCTLSVPLVGVTALTLLSLELPQTWYTTAAAKGTNAFVFQTLGDLDAVFTREVTIPDGNYSNLALVAAVQAALNATAAELGVSGGPWFDLVQDPYNGLATLTSTFPKTVKLTWFDPTYPTLANARLNSNLGWELGFRFPSTAIETGSSVTAIGVVAASSSTKYLILKIDDHTSNRLANTIVSLRTNPDQQIRLPSYTAQSKLSLRTNNQVSAFPSAPRRLTTKQLFSISSISAIPSLQRARADGADTTDFFAKIPIKHQNDWANFANGVNKMKEDGPGKLIVEMAGTLQKNKRVYFGPVTLRKLTVSLYDDRGNLLGLNQNWSFTLEASF